MERIKNKFAKGTGGDQSGHGSWGFVAIGFVAICPYLLLHPQSRYFTNMLGLSTLIATVMDP
jgi:hypothetical protein